MDFDRSNSSSRFGIYLIREWAQELSYFDVQSISTLSLKENSIIDVKTSWHTFFPSTFSMIEPSAFATNWIIICRCVHQLRTKYIMSNSLVVLVVFIGLVTELSKIRKTLPPPPKRVWKYCRHNGYRLTAISGMKKNNVKQQIESNIGTKKKNQGKWCERDVCVCVIATATNVAYKRIAARGFFVRLRQIENERNHQCCRQKADFRCTQKPTTFMSVFRLFCSCVVHVLVDLMCFSV